MKVFVGTIITIVSSSIIALLFWYNHFYMIAFGRGLPEASFYQRMIATVIQSAPFIVFIYLVFKNAIFRNNDEKEAPVKKKWSLVKIAVTFVCVCILWPLPSGVLIGVYFQMTQKGSVMVCNQMESDVQNTRAAISSYYANPDNIALPSVDQLIEEERLSTYFHVTLEEDSNGNPFITVFDDDAECMKGKKLVSYLNEVESEWKD